MIDIHCHILPGLDDGADSLEEAVAMARRAVADGIRCIVATPHVLTGLYHNTREAILLAAAHLQEALQKAEIPLTLLPGAEYRLEPDLPQRLSRGELMTLNDTGRYLLVEFPATLIPDYANPVFYQLLLQGVTPIIAHPERHTGFAREPATLQELVERGALTQLTAGSLTGLIGPAAASVARSFLKHGCAHFIATDAHAATGRAPVLALARKTAVRLVGEERATHLVTGNPHRVLRGERIETEEILPLRPARRSFLDFFRRPRA